MSTEIIGMVGTKQVSESHGSFDGPPIDAAYLTRFAQAHEATGFDRVLIGYGATGPDGFAVAAHVLYATSALKVLIAYRPGFVAPSLVARKLATLDQLSGGGRVAIHHITDGDELDQKRDGDFADHGRRYAHTAEFMSMLHRELTGIPLYFSGTSAAAVEVGACHADVYMLWGEPVDQVAERIAQIRSAAVRHGRTVRFSLSVQPIMAETEEAAWRSAEEIRSATARRVGEAKTAQMYGAHVPTRGAQLFGFRESSSVGSQRRQRRAAERDARDERLRCGVTKLTGHGGNSTALVGTPRQVSEALMAYRRVGVDTVLIRGFNPLDDVVERGPRVVPLPRAGREHPDRN